MFDSVGWGEILVLIVAGLFILGPERLPGAAAWLGKSIKQVKEYASGAKEQLRGELGSEFDELRKPFEELRGLRTFNPRSAATSALFGDEPPGVALFGDDPPVKPNGFGTAPQSVTNGSGIDMTKPQATPLAQNERPPIDDDAT